MGHPYGRAARLRAGHFGGTRRDCSGQRWDGPVQAATHILPGAAMSYAQLEALRFLAACFGIGAAIGLIRGIIVELRRS